MPLSGVAFVSGTLLFLFADKLAAGAAIYNVLWAAAGTPHAVFATSYEELVRLTGGTPADVGAK